MFLLLSQEDPTVNRLDESLNLFSQIVNNRFFREASFVLFLNKFDLFREKILYSGRHLRLYFPDYKGNTILLNPLAPEFFFLISAHPVYKM